MRKEEAMNEQLRTNEQDDPAIGSDQSVRAGTIVDDDDDTEAHGGKIFIRIESRLDDVADQDARATT